MLFSFYTILMKIFKIVSGFGQNGLVAVILYNNFEFDWKFIFNTLSQGFQLIFVTIHNFYSALCVQLFDFLLVKF